MSCASCSTYAAGSPGWFSLTCLGRKEKARVWDHRMLSAVRHLSCLEETRTSGTYRQTFNPPDFLEIVDMPLDRG